MAQELSTVETYRAWRGILVQMASIPNLRVILQETRVSGIRQGVDFPNATVHVQLTNKEHRFECQPTFDNVVKVKQPNANMPKRVRYDNVIGNVVASAAKLDAESALHVAREREQREQEAAREARFKAAVGDLPAVMRNLVPANARDVDLMSYRSWSLEPNVPRDGWGRGSFALECNKRDGEVSLTVKFHVRDNALQTDPQFYERSLQLMRQLLTLVYECKQDYTMLAAAKEAADRASA